MAESEGIIFGYTVISIVFVMILANILTLNRSSSSYLIWHLISWIYLIKWFALLNIDSSAVLTSFTKGFISVFYPFSIVTFTNTNSVPSEFTKIGFTNPYFLNNLDVTLIIWLSTIVFYLIVLLLRCSSFENLKKVVCENLIIRSLLIFFSELNIFSMLQIVEFEISTWYGITNSMLAVLTILILIIFFIFITFNIHYRIREGNPENISRLYTVVEEFDKDSFKKLLYYSLFMFERLMIPAGLVFFRGFKMIQIFIVEFSVCLKFVYVVLVRPFTRTLDNFIVAFLDSLSILAAFLIILLSAGNSSNNKDLIAWIECSFIMIGTGATFGLYCVRLFQNQAFEGVQDNNRISDSKDDVVNQTHVESSIDNKAKNVVYDDNFIQNTEGRPEKSTVINPRKQSVMVSKEDNHQTIKNDINHRRSTFRQSKIGVLTDIEDLANDRDNEVDYNKVDEKNERLPYYNVLFTKYMKREGLDK